MGASERHIGVSELRKFNKKRMKQLNADCEIVIVHDGPKPISAMISYKVFMAYQELIRASQSPTSNEKYFQTGAQPK
jgi:hypothetical protein